MTAPDTTDAAAVRVRPGGPADAHWATPLLTSRWGSTTIISRGRSHDASQLPSLVAEIGSDRLGLATYRIDDRDDGDHRDADDDNEAELVTLDALVSGCGIGTALLRATAERAAASGCWRLWLVTTNDNLDALRFYQRRGLRIAVVHRGAADEARKIKPAIPRTGLLGIPIHDELELELRLRRAPAYADLSPRGA